MATQDTRTNRIFAEAHFARAAMLNTDCNMPEDGRSPIYVLVLEPVMRQSQCVAEGGRG